MAARRRGLLSGNHHERPARRADTHRTENGDSAGKPLVGTVACQAFSVRGPAPGDTGGRTPEGG